MKYLSIFNFFLLGWIYPQTTFSEQLISKAQINDEIEKARELSGKDLKRTIEILKKINLESEAINYKKGILESNNMLMAKYYDMGKYKDVIELSEETEKLALENNDNEILSNTYRLRAIAYTELGFNDESLKNLKKAFGITKKIKSKNYKFYQKALIYNGFASYSAHINAPIDSVIYYQKKSLETAEKLDNNKDYIDKKHFTLALAYINLSKTSVALHHTKDAENYLSKALEICHNKNKYLEVSTYNEFAWLYYDQKKYDKSINFGKLADKLEKQISSPYTRRDIYEVMFKAYVETGEKEKSSIYMNLYTKLNDSLVNLEKKTINTPLKLIKDEQGEIYINNIYKILAIGLASLIVLLLILWVFWRRNQQILHKKYRAIINEIKVDEKSKSKSQDSIQDKGIAITDATTKNLLEKLARFESSKKFLKKEVSRVYVANYLNTNTRYLSDIIKEYRGKNFNNYINGLRIQYITEMLYNNPLYREYKISFLAEDCGFASREVFAVVFKKETGVTPSYFISQLKNDSKETAL
ncbi:helix-turn-helix domain-containing protein [Epilithonimonas sp.]|uniref:helix-turn-helix domain-containing protein n=1 Tax=Epilithonimonas sp. TaxID=2894511 RepID=UPI0028997AAA|nr:helix-turn-helix domain-containing protein [Epilithonimonas sp.]